MACKRRPPVVQDLVIEQRSPCGPNPSTQSESAAFQEEPREAFGLDSPRLSAHDCLSQKTPDLAAPSWQTLASSPRLQEFSAILTTVELQWDGMQHPRPTSYQPFS